MSIWKYLFGSDTPPKGSVEEKIQKLLDNDDDWQVLNWHHVTYQDAGSIVFFKLKHISGLTLERTSYAKREWIAEIDGDRANLGDYFKDAVTKYSKRYWIYKQRYKSRAVEKIMNI